MVLCGIVWQGREGCGIMWYSMAGKGWEGWGIMWYNNNNNNIYLKSNIHKSSIGKGGVLFGIVWQGRVGYYMV